MDITIIIILVIILSPFVILQRWFIMKHLTDDVKEVFFHKFITYLREYVFKLKKDTNNPNEWQWYHFLIVVYGGLILLIIVIMLFT